MRTRENVHMDTEEVAHNLTTQKYSENTLTRNAPRRRTMRCDLAFTAAFGKVTAAPELLVQIDCHI